MARGPTVAELLAAGKKKAKQIRKKAVKDVEALIPPILGPAGRVAPSVANLAGIATETLINEVADRAFQDFQQTQVPVTRTTHPRPQIQAGLDAGTIGYDLDGELRDMESIPSRNKLILAGRRSDKQLVNDQIQSNALKSLNLKARKKDGSFKKGWDQRRVMKMAQKECTRERERLGLCKRKRKRGKNSR